jgi:hypothetical protein
VWEITGTLSTRVPIAFFRVTGMVFSESGLRPCRGDAVHPGYARTPTSAPSI